jgi:hypothetical protein
MLAPSKKQNQGGREEEEGTNVRLIVKSAPARRANPGARTLHLYGRFVPFLPNPPNRSVNTSKKRKPKKRVRTNEIYPHLPFLRLDRTIGLPLTDELEMVNERFHAFFR